MTHPDSSRLYFEQIFGDRIPGIYEFSPEDILRRKGDIISKLVDGGIDYLRAPTFPNPKINDLMTLFWRLVGNRKSNIMLLDQSLPGLFAWIEFNEGQTVGNVIVPTNYLDLWKAMPLHHLGGLVYTASEIQDWWNGKVLAKAEMIARARAYEAEYIITMGEQTSFQLSPYQEAVLKQYPRGLDSLPDVMRYPVRTFSSDDTPIQPF